MININDLSEKYNLGDVYNYGKYMAKVQINDKLTPKGKLILVSAITPTTSGEGKTTVSIGLVDALNKINKKCCGVLREPSLGPVFGLKGGAIGGGKSIIEPSNEINMHFTGDFHAITSANNLIAAAIDNHIYFGNELGIVNKTFKRCIDMNDRELRDNFNITAASELMSIFCLSKDINDLKRRIGNIIIGFDKDNKPIYAKELHIEGAACALLKDAIKPNIVQTGESNLIYVHGGPFANLSIGTSSFISINEGLKNFDYVVTEAGFAADLGALKFFDVMCRNNNIEPFITVLVVTNKAVKENGLENIMAHINIVKTFGIDVVVAINRFDDDKDEDIKYIADYLENNNIKYSITTSYKDGSLGSIDLANIIVEDSNSSSLKQIYNLDDDIEYKISKICNNMYGARNINYSDRSINMIDIIKNNKYNYPICIAKTQYSISDDKNKKGVPKDYDITVKDIEILNGAELIVVKLNNILSLPGLNKEPNYINIDVVDNQIIGVK